MNNIKYSDEELVEGELSLKRSVRLECLDLPLSSIEVKRADVVKFLDNRAKGKLFKIGDYL